MFEFIRTHKKWMQVLLALLIIPSFVVVGVSSYGGGGGPAMEEVANVGGQKVTQLDLDEAQRQQLDRARSAMGERFNAKEFETPEAKQAVLDNLVSQRALDAELRASHMTVSDEVLMKEIGKIEAFKKPDGSFDLDGYKALLAAQGMRPTQFQEQMRRDLALQQLNTAIQSSAFAPRAVAARLSEIADQEREVQELVFPASDFVAQVQVTPAMVKAYYDKNAPLFQIPEQVKAEYVVFDAAAVEKQVTVSDDDVAAYYKAEQKKFTTPEERLASHILINVKAGDAAQNSAAKAKADAVLAEVRAAPANFAAIAKTRSEDIASAELGGDLGNVASVDPQLAAPLQKLKQGEVSLVETSYGYHIITVTKVTPAVIKPLDEVKLAVAAELKKQKMSKKYSELVETFNNTVDEQSESLKPVADKLGLTVQVIEHLTRTPSAALGAVPANNAKFLKALFSADSLKNKRNVEAVEVAPSVLVAGRVLEYKPAAARPLAEVEAVIRQRVAQEEATKLAQKAGAAKIAAAKLSGDAAGFGAAKVVTRNKPPTIAPAAMLAVLKADVTKLPAYVGVDVPGVGYGVYRIGKVTQPAQVDVARRKAEQEQIGGVIAQQEMYSYIDALKVKAKSKIKLKPTTVSDAK
ncbi:SurA N-terminal domain-containing protein [Massilia sp. TSP1-1-2]|uniref:SurA N-terminal domain-containing protein n=1 Tax=Massilia sp. TSP1-1-2 TaxID=2804649 RepID=UPI003CFA19CD